MRDLAAVIELAKEAGFVNPYSTHEVLVVRPNAKPEVVDAGETEAPKLVRELHNVGGVIPRAAARCRL